MTKRPVAIYVNEETARDLAAGRVLKHRDELAKQAVFYLRQFDREELWRKCGIEYHGHEVEMPVALWQVIMWYRALGHLFLGWGWLSVLPTSFYISGSVGNVGDRVTVDSRWF